MDLWALWIVLGFGALFGFFWRRSQHIEPHFLFSKVSDVRGGEASKKVYFALLPSFLRYLTLIFFLVAFLDPHFFFTKAEKDLKKPEDKILDREKLLSPTEGIAVYLLVDVSSSMGRGTAVEEKGVFLTKLGVLKRVLRDFIFGNLEKGLEGRSNDLIGLISFARGAQVLSPLTLDHEVVGTRLSELNVVTDPNQDGTAIGYALFKVVNVIAATKHFAEEQKGEGKPAYDIKSYVVLLVTDGFQNPSRLDGGKFLRNIGLEEAAGYARKHHVKLYIVNTEPRIMDSEYEPHRNQMNRVAELTGGKFYVASEPTSLQKVYAEIDQLEKSKLPSLEVVRAEKEDRNFERFSFFPAFIVFGMSSLLLSILMETLVIRKIP